jgi:hypothetical protein
MNRHMHQIVAVNVNDALVNGLYYLRAAGVPQPSRNGPVLVAPGPVVTKYLNPTQRVLFSVARDANPFFHLFEALWMLAGRNDIAFLAQFNKRMADYSDDGTTQWGAYGHRWRQWFGYDQLAMLVKELSTNPNSRRCVLAMWDASGGELDDWGGGCDLARAVGGGKDVPCNTHIYFQVVQGELEMTVCCRSNDIYWGAYGANAVHFSILQEYLASSIGVKVGLYYQFSNNYHLYTDVVNIDERQELLHSDDRYHYESGKSSVVRACPLVDKTERFDAELSEFLVRPWGSEYQEPFLRYVATPMWLAWNCRKLGASASPSLEAASILRLAMIHGSMFEENDWLTAGYEWMMRRAEKETA